MELLETRCYLAGDPIVTVDTNFGNFQIELRPDAAPQTVANFLQYVERGAYTDAIFHRSVPGFVEQTGGFTSASATFTSTSQFTAIPTNAPVPLEYDLPNIVGSVAAARTSNPNSATDEWYVNLVDNSRTLGPSGVDPYGYAVFGQVIGNGMQVINAIAALPVDNADNSTFSQLPLGPNNELVRINSVTLDSIDGTVFTDLNGNGQLDAGEPGVAGRTVFLDIDGSGEPDSQNPSTTTDANGNYTFSGLAPGTYDAMEVLAGGVALTTPSQIVTVTAGQTATANFGEKVENRPGTLAFSAATYNANETDSSATIIIDRTGGGTGAVSVTVTTSNGTATAGTDYTATSQTVNWPDGDMTPKTVSIPLLDDNATGESAQTVNLALSNATGGATIATQGT
ncbi:MAG: peptidylprolyl isomerase, partial [Pirellulales bacterium]